MYFEVFLRPLLSLRKIEVGVIEGGAYSSFLLRCGLKALIYDVHSTLHRYRIHCQPRRGSTLGLNKFSARI
jgi:hypothetical protein